MLRVGRAGHVFTISLYEIRYVILNDLVHAPAASHYQGWFLVLSSSLLPVVVLNLQNPAFVLYRAQIEIPFLQGLVPVQDSHR